MSDLDNRLIIEAFVNRNINEEMLPFNTGNQNFNFNNKREKDDVEDIGDDELANFYLIPYTKYLENGKFSSLLKMVNNELQNTTPELMLVIGEDKKWHILKSNNNIISKHSGPFNNFVEAYEFIVSNVPGFKEI